MNSAVQAVMDAAALTVLSRPTAMDTEQAGASGAVLHPLAAAAPSALPVRMRNSSGRICLNTSLPDPCINVHCISNSAGSESTAYRLKKRAGASTKEAPARLFSRLYCYDSRGFFCAVTDMCSLCQAASVDSSFFF